MRNELFKTNVGSHIWNMDTPLSDIDYFVVYLAPLEDILLQRRPKSKHQIDNTLHPVSDYAIHEIGHVIGQLKKSNFNFIIGIMSPIEVSKGEMHLEFLRNWVKNNISKQIYYSIRGLAMSNHDDTNNLGYLRNQKKAKLVLRTLIFGIHLLRTGEFLFRPIVAKVKAEHIDYYLDELDRAFEESNLPDYVGNYDELEDWLIGVRLAGV